MSLPTFSRRSELGQTIRVSFEFFPPKTAAVSATLGDTLRRLASLSPDFCSVTYGAGGSTRGPTADALAKIMAETDMPAASHITCVDATREEVDQTVRDFAAMGVKRFVALRGDPSAGVGARYRPHPGGYAGAADLIEGLKKIGDFDISVAAYPEKHPESPDFATDIEFLKRKVDAGASRALTQFCFDNDVFEAYVERARRAGIYVPIVPGILPIHNFRQVSNFAGRCGAHIPGWLADRFDGLDNDPQTHSLVAAAVAAEQVVDLIERGVRDFHFYTMNRPDLVFAICHMIGIRPKQRAVENGIAA